MNLQLKKILVNIERTAKRKKIVHIFINGMLYRTIIPAGIIMILIVSLGYFSEQFILQNLLIKIPILLIIGYDIGKLEFEFFMSIRDGEKSIKVLRNKFLVFNGVLGWGLFCFVILNDFYPLDIPYSLLNLMISLIIGTFLGIVMFGILKPYFEAAIEYYELKEEREK